MKRYATYLAAALVLGACQPTNPAKTDPAEQPPPPAAPDPNLVAGVPAYEAEAGPLPWRSMTQPKAGCCDAYPMDPFGATTLAHSMNGASHITSVRVVGLGSKAQVELDIEDTEPDDDMPPFSEPWQRPLEFNVVADERAQDPVGAVMMVGGNSVVAAVGITSPAGYALVTLEDRDGAIRWSSGPHRGPDAVRAPPTALQISIDGRRGQAHRTVVVYLEGWNALAVHDFNDGRRLAYRPVPDALRHPPDLALPGRPTLPALLASDAGRKVQLSYRNGGGQLGWTSVVDPIMWETLYAAEDDTRVYAALFGRHRSAVQVFGLHREDGRALWKMHPRGVAPPMHHDYPHDVELRLVDGNLHVVAHDPRGRTVTIVDPATGSALAQHFERQ